MSTNRIALLDYLDPLAQLWVWFDQDLFTDESISKNFDALVSHQIREIETFEGIAQQLITLDEKHKEEVKNLSLASKQAKDAMNNLQNYEVAEMRIRNAQKGKTFRFDEMEGSIALANILRVNLDTRLQAKMSSTFQAYGNALEVRLSQAHETSLSKQIASKIDVLRKNQPNWKDVCEELLCDVGNPRTIADLEYLWDLENSPVKKLGASHQALLSDYKMALAQCIGKNAFCPMKQKEMKHKETQQMWERKRERRAEQQRSDAEIRAKYASEKIKASQSRWKKDEERSKAQRQTKEANREEYEKKQYAKQYAEQKQQRQTEEANRKENEKKQYAKQYAEQKQQRQTEEDNRKQYAEEKQQRQDEARRKEQYAEQQRKHEEETDIGLQADRESQAQSDFIKQKEISDCKEKVCRYNLRSNTDYRRLLQGTDEEAKKDISECYKNRIYCKK
jgi:hypothetical protein